MTSRVLITAPTADVISLANVKVALGISSTSQDGMLQAALNATIAQLDPSFGGWLGRALRPQTWELRMPSFYSSTEMLERWKCYGAIELPFPPLISITSVKYDDSNSVEQTMPTTDYRVLGSGTLGKQAIAPIYGGVWPSTKCDTESTRIRFQCGYATSPDALPPSIGQAVALSVRSLLSDAERNLYLAREDVPGVRGRQWVVSPAAGEVIQKSISGLLSTYRVWN